MSKLAVNPSSPESAESQRLEDALRQARGHESVAELKPPSLFVRSTRAAPAWLLTLAALAVTATLAMYALMAIYPDAVGAASVLINTLDDVAIVFALAASAMAYRTSIGSERTMWGFFAIGLAAWLIAEVIVDLRTLAFGAGDESSFADLFYLLYYPFVLAALHARERDRPAAGINVGMLDTLIVTSAAALLMWQAVVSEAIDGSGDTVTTITNLSYPVLDVAVIWMLVRPLYERGTVWAESRIFLALGLFGVFIGDALWLSTHYDLYAMVLAPAMILIGIAALLHQRVGDDSRPVDESKRRVVEAAVLIGSTAVIVGMVLSETRGDLTLLIGSAIVVGLLLIRVLLANDQNEQLLTDAERRAGTDSLTGLLNHQRFEQRLDDELALAARREEPVALLMIDIDNFKAVNDIGGHQVGDRVLREIASRVREVCRSTDAVCRVGGDEMAIIAPNTDAMQALDLAERARKNVSEIAIGELHRNTRAQVSIGCSVFPQLAKNATELVNGADSALYSVKRTTRNGTALFDPSSPELEDPERELSRLHAQLQMAESDFRAVFAHARDVMLITDNRAAIINANDAAVRFTGVSPEQMAGMSVFDFIHPEHTESFGELVRETLSRGMASGHFSVSLPDGRRPIVEYATSRVAPDRFLTVIRDVTEKEKRSKNLAQSEAGFRALFDHALDAIMITDDQGVIRGANHAACALTGKSLPELLGRKGADLVEAGDVPKISAAQDALARDQEMSGSMMLRDAEGALREVEFTSVADFVPGRHLSIIREVTDRQHPEPEIGGGPDVRADA